MARCCERLLSKSARSRDHHKPIENLSVAGRLTPTVIQIPICYHPNGQPPFIASWPSLRKPRVKLQPFQPTIEGPTTRHSARKGHCRTARTLEGSATPPAYFFGSFSFKNGPFAKSHLNLAKTGVFETITRAIWQAPVLKLELLTFLALTNPPHSSLLILKVPAAAIRVAVFFSPRSHDPQLPVRPPSLEWAHGLELIDIGPIHHRHL